MADGCVPEETVKYWLTSADKSMSVEDSEKINKMARKALAALNGDVYRDWLMLDTPVFELPYLDRLPPYKLTTWCAENGCIVLEDDENDTHYEISADNGQLMMALSRNERVILGPAPEDWCYERVFDMYTKIKAAVIIEGMLRRPIRANITAVMRGTLTVNPDDPREHSAVANIARAMADPEPLSI